MDVYNILGGGFLEIVYKDALEYEFKTRGIPYEREKEFNIVYKDVVLPHKFYADFTVFNSIVLEVKAVSAITDEFIKQTLNYLTITEYRLGLIVNFGRENFTSRRIVL